MIDKNRPKKVKDLTEREKRPSEGKIFRSEPNPEKKKNIHRKTGSVELFFGCDY